MFVCNEDGGIEKPESAFEEAVKTVINHAKSNDEHLEIKCEMKIIGVEKRLANET